MPTHSRERLLTILAGIEIVQISVTRIKANAFSFNELCLYIILSIL
jgi:hypothetical protein